jgi:subfamily B ATP-binding cassette protein MsbA
MYWYILRYYGKHAGTISFFCFFFSLFSAASVSVLMPFVNFIFAGYDPANLLNLPFSLPIDKYYGLVILCGITWIFFLLKNLSFVAAQNQTSVLKNDLLQKLREDQFERILSQDMFYFHSLHSGTPLARMLDVTRQFADKLSLGFYDAARTIPLISMYSALLLAISWKLTALSLLVVPLISLAGNRFHKMLNRSIAEEQNTMGQLIQQVQQKLYGIKLVKLFHSEKKETEEFHQKNSRLKQVLHSREQMESTGIAVLEMIGVSAGVAILYVLGIETLGGRFSLGPGGFVLFIAAVFSLIDPVRQLMRSFHSFREAEIMLMDLQKLERIPPKAYSLSIERFEHAIEFHDVSFGFPARKEPVIKNLNWTIHKGEKIALTGRSGIGKSTLIDLLLGLYQPASGSVTLDGKPISEIERQDIARIFSVATQEPFVFHDSIRCNLAYNLSDFDDNALLKAMEQVGLSDWYHRQPNGLNTLIGERGQKMSGGEKQKLVLARMILRDPDILIFDEATSALDLAAEKEILEMILRLFGNKTLILISHRPTFLPFADRIVEISLGSIHGQFHSTFS